MSEPETANPQPAKIRRQYDELDTMRRVEDLIQSQDSEARHRIMAWLTSKLTPARGVSIAQAASWPGSQQHVTIPRRPPAEISVAFPTVRIDEDDGA